jgi:hypothetical protein
MPGSLAHGAQHPLIQPWDFLSNFLRVTCLVRQHAVLSRTELAAKPFVDQKNWQKYWYR